MSLTSIDDALSTASAKSYFNKDSLIGSTIQGKIIQVDQRQVTDFVTKQPKTWDDGKPQLQILITLQTSLNEGDQDTGERVVYVKTWGEQKRALVEAIKNTGVPDAKASTTLLPGSVFTAKLVGEKPSKQGSPIKIFEYAIQPASVGAVDTALSTDSAEATTVAATPTTAATATASSATPTVTANPAVIKQLIAIGQTPEQIAAQTGLSTEVVTILAQTA